MDKVTGSFLYSRCFFFSVPLGISQRAKHLLKKSILDWPLFLSLHIFWSFKGLLALWPFIASDYGFVSSHSDGLAEVTRSHFAARSPLETQAHQQTYSFYFYYIFLATFQTSKSENGSGGKFNTMSVSFLNNLHLQNYCFYSTDWLRCGHFDLSQHEKYKRP